MVVTRWFQTAESDDTGINMRFSADRPVDPLTAPKILEVDANFDIDQQNEAQDRRKTIH